MIAIAVHGGAGNKGKRSSEAREGVLKALETGWSILQHGGSALDAVEAAVRVLETLPAFNAGLGSVLTTSGKVEMDAGIMDGDGLRIGAVAAVSNIRHPISLARKVMEETPHILLAGDGAMEFAWAQGFKYVPNEDLIASHRLQDWMNNRGLMEGADTVGAVALDSKGNLAAATSTGGITGKMPGRVGDSPLPGCGFWADNDFGAVSTTGWGETIARSILAKRVVDRMERGEAPEEAARQALEYLEKKIGGWAGLVLVTKEGELIASYNSKSMCYALMKDGWRSPKTNEPSGDTQG